MCSCNTEANLTSGILHSQGKIQFRLQFFKIKISQLFDWWRVTSTDGFSIF